MTKNLKIFTLISLVWAVGFFTVLNWFLYNPDRRWPFILCASIVYGFGFAVAGSQLGKRDPTSRTRINLSFWYGCIAAISSLLINGLWVLFIRTDERMDFIWVALLMVLAFSLWAVLSRRTIKGMPKKELFR